MFHHVSNTLLPPLQALQLTEINPFYHLLVVPLQQHLSIFGWIIGAQLDLF